MKAKCMALLVVLAAFVVMAMPAAAAAPKPVTVFVAKHATSVSLTRAQAHHLKVGTMITFAGPGAAALPSFYPSEGGQSTRPPFDCIPELSGLGIFWGGSHWTCSCQLDTGCIWNEDYVDQEGHPDGYVDRPPFGRCGF